MGVHGGLLVVVEGVIFIEGCLFGTGHDTRSQIWVAICDGEDETLHLVQTAFAIGSLLVGLMETVKGVRDCRGCFVDGLHY